MSRKSNSRSIGSNRSKGTNKSFATNRSYSTNRTNGTLTSQSSYIKTNSGNFDGGNNRRNGRKSSSSSATLQRKSSAATQREQIIAEFYRDLEELDEERSSSDSSSDDGDYDADDLGNNGRKRSGGTRQKTQKKLKKGSIVQVEEVKSRQRVEEYLMNLEQPDPNEVDGEDRDFEVEEDEGIRSDMSEGRYGSSFNSSYSSDVPMVGGESTGSASNNHYRSGPKYIRKPNPPAPRMIAELDASPGTSRLYKVRGDQRVLTLAERDDNSSAHQYDINENTLADKTHHKHKHRDLQHKKGLDKYNDDKSNNNSPRQSSEISRSRQRHHQLPKQPKEVQLIDRTLLRDSFNAKKDKQQHPLVNKENLYMVDSDSDSSCSTDSANGDSDGSESTVSSVSIPRHSNHKASHHHRNATSNSRQQKQQIHKMSPSFVGLPVPKNNFIPGQTPSSLSDSKRSYNREQQQQHLLQHKTTTTKQQQKQAKNDAARKVSFCFRGVPFRVYNNTPRTHRALAHAGCIALIIPSPENHKCNH